MVYKGVQKGHVLEADTTTGMISTDPDNVDSPFVLMPRKDPAAFAAMIMYAHYCEKGLAEEIKDWLTKVAMAPTICGSQGERNRRHLDLKALRDIL